MRLYTRHNQPEFSLYRQPHPDSSLTFTASKGDVGHGTRIGDGLHDTSGVVWLTYASGWRNAATSVNHRIYFLACSAV